MMKHTLSLGLSAMMLSACVSQSHWTPTVDTYGNSRAQYVTRDQQECRELAMQSSGGSSTGQAAQGAVVGGLLGAAAGAAIGAAAGGGAGRGAAVGAAAGGIGTGAVRGVQSNQAFQRAFNQCMRNRGHNVLS